MARGGADDHKYKAVSGIDELHQRIVDKLRSENQIEVEPDSRLVVTAGGNMAFFNAILAIADPGDEIILPAPYYFNQEMAIAMLNCRGVIVPTGREYELDLGAIRRAIGPRTRAVVTISPNNPSGAVYTRAALLAVNELCRSAGIYHISDEAYEYFVYDGAVHFSPGSLPGAAQHTISLFSLSKAYGFAAWRIGYMTVPERLLTAIKKAQDTILICPPVISQEAACGCLAAGPDYCRRQVAELAHVRRYVLDELAAVADCCHVARTQGAFYFLLRVATELTAVEMVERLIREFGVGVLPGTTFGIEQGCTLRLAYGALDAETVCDGLGRLARGIRALKQALSVHCRRILNPPCPSSMSSGGGLCHNECGCRSSQCNRPTQKAARCRSSDARLTFAGTTKRPISSPCASCSRGSKSLRRP